MLRLMAMDVDDGFILLHLMQAQQYYLSFVPIIVVNRSYYIFILRYVY